MSADKAREIGKYPLRLGVLYTPLTRWGGAERQLFEEVRALRARGHELGVFTFALAGDVMRAVGGREPRITVLRCRGAAGKVVALRRAVAEFCPDLMVSHTSPELTWLATRHTRVPYVLYHNSPPYYIGADAAPYMASRRYRRVFPQVSDTVAGYADFEHLPGVGIRNRAAAELRTMLKGAALRDAEAVIVLSERTRRELRLIHNVEAVAVRGCLNSSVVNGGAATAQTAATRRTPSMVLSVCRLDPVKRVDLLLRAFALVAGEFPDATLVVGGRGPELKPLTSTAAMLGLTRRVRFVGFIPEQELASYYAAAGVFATPAMADFNIAPYEALASGCKVVWTTEMETAPELEASGCVFVAEPEETAFATALANALRAPPGLKPDLSAMTWEARALALDTIYRTAVR